MSSTAFAVPSEIRFDAPPLQGREPSISFTVDDITATARGGTNEGGLGARDVHQNSEGLGVFAGGTENRNIDGFGRDEFLQIDYNTSVRLLRVDFENVDGNDESALVVDGFQLGFGLIESALGLSGASANCGIGGDLDECQLSIDVSSLNIVGKSFRFGDALAGSGFSLDSNDNFRIEAMVVDAAPVPEPGTLALMGTGLVSFLGYRWRRRKQEQNV